MANARTWLVDDDFTVTVASRGAEPPSAAAAAAVVVVGVRGELDLDTADRLWARVGPLLAPGAVVVLDAARMPFMDSSGLRVLLRVARRAAETGATFRVAALCAAVARVVDLA